MSGPTILNARAISSTRVRVDFSDAVAANSALHDPASFDITTADLTAETPTILSVFVPTAVPTRTIDLITSEMTDGAIYDFAVVSDNVIGELGDPVDQTPYPFTGIGEKPQVLVAVATSPTTVEVRFTEKMRDLGAVRDTASYSFITPPGALSVLEVLEVDNDIITLRTSTQTEEELYTLQVNGTFYDFANNTLVVPVTTPMLGFRPPPTVEEPLQLNMYDFIIEVIREEDQNNGNQFLKRFLQGPQEVWKATNQIILSIPKLWSISEIPDNMVYLLKFIVGWTTGYDRLTQRLDPTTLRRLIQNSVAFWRDRGPEDTIEDIIRLTTGSPIRIFNYFDWRWIMGETHFGEEHDGFDPWILSELPEGTQCYQIRIVDNGTLDHILVREFARITRPIGERVEIIYTTFYDRFITVNDKSQWTDVAGVSQAPGVVLRLPNLVSPESTYASVPDSTEWRQYVATFRARGTTAYEFIFYRVAETDQYYLKVTTGPTSPNHYGKLELFKIVAGVTTSIGSVDMTHDKVIYDNVYYTYRIEVIDTGSTNEIRVYVDAEQLLIVHDAAHASGSVGIRRKASSGVMELDECEVFRLPVVSDFIDINE